MIEHRFRLSGCITVSDVGLSEDELWRKRERKALVEALRLIEANISYDKDLAPSEVRLVLSAESDKVRRWEVAFR